MPAKSLATSDFSIGIDAAQVSALLGISQSHFFALVRTGRFGPEPRRLGRAKRYDRDEVVAWFKAGCPARGRGKQSEGVHDERRAVERCPRVHQCWRFNHSD